MPGNTIATAASRWARSASSTGAYSYRKSRGCSPLHLQMQFALAKRLRKRRVFFTDS
nr:MAG TPA: hypothetical protein [Caudoviricetes sp.]